MRILITAGPTREYLDDVRFLSNASSGKMGYALAEAAVAAGHDVVLVSGPVGLARPVGCEFHAVETTGEMYDACLKLFTRCEGVIGAAAVCDYRPRECLPGKLSKTGRPIVVDGDRGSVDVSPSKEKLRRSLLRERDEGGVDDRDHGEDEDERRQFLARQGEHRHREAVLERRDL